MMLPYKQKPQTFTDLPQPLHFVEQVRERMGSMRVLLFLMTKGTKVAMNEDCPAYRLLAPCGTVEQQMRQRTHTAWVIVT